MNEFDMFIGKIIVIEYLDGRGKSIRTICTLKEIRGDLIMVESTTKHIPFIVGISRLVSLSELSPEKIDPSKMGVGKAIT